MINNLEIMQYREHRADPEWVRLYCELFGHIDIAKKIYYELDVNHPEYRRVLTEIVRSLRIRSADREAMANMVMNGFMKLLAYCSAKFHTNMEDQLRDQDQLIKMTKINPFDNPQEYIRCLMCTFDADPITWGLEEQVLLEELKDFTNLNEKVKADFQFDDVASIPKEADRVVGTYLCIGANPIVHNTPEHTVVTSIAEVEAFSMKFETIRIFAWIVGPSEYLSLPLAVIAIAWNSSMYIKLFRSDAILNYLHQGVVRLITKPGASRTKKGVATGGLFCGPKMIRIDGEDVLATSSFPFIS